MKQMYDIINQNADIEFDQRLKEKDSEIKYYLICITAKVGYGDDTWSLLQGRTAAYEFIKDNIDMINFDESFILVEGLGLEHRKSIYAFIKYAEQFFPNDTFDIDDYIKGDWDEHEYQLRNDIDSRFSDNDHKFDLKDIMDGSTKFTN